MNVATIRRIYLPSGTLGQLHVRDECGDLLFSCKTLELPDKGNKRSVSCIPEGVYRCERTYSPAFKTQLYLVKDVEGRSGIRIHPANYTRQLRGCIALGKAHLDIDKDGNYDVTSSRDTVAAFEKAMKNEPFELRILGERY